MPREQAWPCVCGVRCGTRERAGAASVRFRISSCRPISMCPAASSRDPGAVMLPLSGIGETSQDVLVPQLGEVLENVLFGRAGRELRQHVVHGDAQAANAGLPTALARLDRDAVKGHASDSRRRCRRYQETVRPVLPMPRSAGPGASNVPCPVMAARRPPPGCNPGPARVGESARAAVAGHGLPGGHLLHGQCGAASEDLHTVLRTLFCIV